MTRYQPKPLKPVQKDSYPSDLLSAFARFRNEGQFTDFKIKVKGKIIHTHKIILAASCPYFEALFRSKMKENLTGEIVFDALEYEIVNIVIQHIYGNEILIEWQQLPDMISACEFLQLTDLKDQLESYMCDNVNVENCISIFNIAQLYSLKKVMTASAQIKFDELDKVCKTDTFKSLTWHQLSEYFQSMKEKFDNKDSMLKAAMVWIQEKPSERKKLLSDIFGQIKVEECSLSALQCITQQFENLLDEPSTKSMLFTAVLPRLQEAEEKKSDKLLLIGLDRSFDQEANDIPQCWIMLLFSHTWQKFASFPSPDCVTYRTVVLPDGFATMGGEEENPKRCMRYIVKTRTWTELPESPVDLDHVTSLVYCNGSIFIFGSDSAFASFGSDTMYYLTLSTLKWTKGQKCLWKMGDPIVCSLNKTIYALSNPEERGQIQSFHSLDTGSTNGLEWKEHCSLPNSIGPIRDADFVFVQNCLYLVGAHEGTMAQYDLESDSWISLQPLVPVAKSRPSVCVLEGKILVAGGGLGGSKLAFEYDIARNAWKKSKLKLPIDTGCHVMQVVNFL